MKNPPQLETFATRLNALRLEAGWSIYRLAKNSALSKNTVTHYIKGEREPTFANAVKLADALGVSLDDLRGKKP
jgi:transcriptional regulator with XRE-family HTH domain